MRILLVEDNRRLSDSLRLILQDNGYAVDTAYDGIEGEEAGMISGYDVIILIQPGGVYGGSDDGITGLNAQRSRVRAKTVPIGIGDKMMNGHFSSLKN